MRGGKVLERVELAANEGISGSAAEILQASVEQFYEDRPAPNEVHLSSEPEDAELLEAWLSLRTGRRVQVVVAEESRHEDEGRSCVRAHSRLPSGSSTARTSLR